MFGSEYTKENKRTCFNWVCMIAYKLIKLAYISFYVFFTPYLVIVITYFLGKSPPATDS